MKKLVVLACFLFLSIAYIGKAAAIPIVDTGPGPEADFGWGLYSNQWLAFEFSLDRAYTITGIEGWVQEDSAGALTIALYTDGGDVPGSIIYSHDFTIQIQNSADSVPDWMGTSDLDWELNAGEYWGAFEVRISSAQGGFSGRFPFPAQNPLENYASVWMGIPGYRPPYDDLDFGVRVYGDPAPVPEPSTFILLGGGLAGLAFAVRRRRRKE